MAVAQTSLSGGFGTALIQKRDPDVLRLSRHLLLSLTASPIILGNSATNFPKSLS